MSKTAKLIVFFGVFMCICLSRAQLFAKSEGKRSGPAGSGSAPYGWSQGKKTGWNNADMPPGLAKRQASVSADQMKSKDHKKKGNA